MGAEEREREGLTGAKGAQAPAAALGEAEKMFGEMNKDLVGGELDLM